MAPEHTAGGWLRQSTGFIGRFSRLIPAVKLRSDIGLSAKQGTVIRENPTRLATYNPAGGGFHWLVENRPDPDAGAGYPSIPTYELSIGTKISDLEGP